MTELQDRILISWLFSFVPTKKSTLTTTYLKYLLLLQLKVKDRGFGMTHILIIENFLRYNEPHRWCNG